MILESINLLNFRSHRKKTFNFSPAVTIILGRNTSGKTNLIEAINYLASGRGFRAGRESEAINYKEELARIKGIVEDSSGEARSLEIMITRGHVLEIKTPVKKYFVNDVARRGIDFVGNFRTVLFWPQNMELVTGSPSLRRRYLDDVLSQADREYHRNLLSYERGLRQRNKLLEAISENRTHRHQLLFWNQLLIKQGNYLTEYRENYLEYANNFRLPKEFEPEIKFRLYYDKSLISESRLTQYSEVELAAHATLVGPHRDDFIFKKQETEDRDLAFFGSRGEQRLAVLWLKLVEYSFLKENSNSTPVLLLDDIFSELDHEHREIIFHIIGKQQTIMTITDKHLVPEMYFREAKVIEL